MCEDYSLMMYFIIMFYSIAVAAVFMAISSKSYSFWDRERYECLAFFSILLGILPVLQFLVVLISIAIIIFVAIGLITEAIVNKKES